PRARPPRARPDPRPADPRPADPRPAGLVARSRPWRLRREAVGIAGRVAALQPDLVRAAATERVALHEEPLVERDPAAGVRVYLGHPRADAVRVELLVPRPVQRVGEVDPGAVPADLDHLRATEQWLVRPG